MIIHTFETMKQAGIGMVDARRLAAQAWQEFQNDVAFEENTKAVKVTAKPAKWHDYAAFALFEDGEISEVMMVIVEDEYGDCSAEIEHHVLQ